MIPESTEETLGAKMAKLGQLYEAIDRAKENVRQHKTPDCATGLQSLEQQVRSLRATLPKMKLVAG